MICLKNMQINSPAVQDLHRIRHMLYNRRKNMSWQQKKQDIDQNVKSFLDEFDLKQVPSGRGIFKLEKVS